MHMNCDRQVPLTSFTPIGLLFVKGGKEKRIQLQNLIRSTLCISDIQPQLGSPETAYYPCNLERDPAIGASSDPLFVDV